MIRFQLNCSSPPDLVFHSDRNAQSYLADLLFGKSAMEKLSPQQRNALRFGVTSEAEAAKCRDDWDFYTNPDPNESHLGMAYTIGCSFVPVTGEQFREAVGAAIGAGGPVFSGSISLGLAQLGSSGARLGNLAASSQ